MTRGEPSPIGTEKLMQNGYIYVKTNDGWKYKHWLVAEKKLGRPLDGERVSFIDGDKTNFKPDNIKIEVIHGTSLKQRLRGRLQKVEERADEIEKQQELLAGEIRGVMEALGDLQDPE